MIITFNESTLQRSSGTAPAGDDKLILWAAEQLRIDARATLEKLLRESVLKAGGKISKNSCKRYLKLVANESGMSLVEWKGKLIACYTDPKIGTDLEKPNKVICMFHYKDLTDEVARITSN